MRSQSRGTGTITVTAATLAALVLLSGCSSGTSAGGSSVVAPIESVGDTYVVPSDLKGERGRLLGAKAVEFGGDQIGAERRTILYESRNSHGAPVAVSGTVLIPKGTPPEGGWPVVSWAHGTVGVADRCAPSHRPDMGYPSYAQYLNGLVRSGYTVVATDYIGLGTPGGHTYMNAVDQKNAVEDIVPAARALDPRLSQKWFVSGHSQGGAAALEATWSEDGASIADRPAATIALAPGNNLGPGLERFAAGGDTHPVRALYFMYGILGMEATGPDIGVDGLLSGAGEHFKQQVSGTCLFDDPMPFSSPDPQSLFKTPRDAGAWDAAIRRASEYGNPDQKPANGPVLVITGSDDLDVPAAGTHALVATLRSQHGDIEELVVPGEDHEQPVNSTFCSQLRFLAGHGGVMLRGPFWFSLSRVFWGLFVRFFFFKHSIKTHYRE